MRPELTGEFVTTLAANYWGGRWGQGRKLHLMATRGGIPNELRFDGPVTLCGNPARYDATTWNQVGRPEEIDVPLRCKSCYRIAKTEGYEF